jgi:hypothetical protein
MVWLEAACDQYGNCCRWVGGYLRDEPIVTLSMNAVTLFVALAYLFRLPTIAALMSSKPNATIWRYAENLALWQAACLFAEVSPPNAMGSWFPVPDADAYYSLLVLAVRDGEVERAVQPGGNARDSATVPDMINFGTFVTRSSLQKFASKRGFNPRFLRQLHFVRD